MHENDTVFTSIPVTATLNIIKKDKKTIQFDGFQLVFPSVKACDGNSSKILLYLLILIIIRFIR